MKDISSIIKTHNALIFKVANVYAVNEQDRNDLYQEIIIQIWKSIGKFQSKSKLSTFLYRVALNTAINYKKKSDRIQSHLDIMEVDLADSSPQPYEIEEDSYQLYTAINKLEPGEKAIILLFLDQLSYQEISEIIGISINHVGVKINRIKSKLFTLLKNRKYE